MRVPIDPDQATTVARQLSKWVKASYPRYRSKHRAGRIQIVNPSLCREALRRLAPSLKPHHDCDLIDINPGTCLWSRHLHDALKPRRHILVEPDREIFDEFITPLIEEDPDRFGYAERLSEVVNPHNRLLSERVINSRIEQPLNTNNNSLLISVNLTGLSEINYRAGSAASYFFNDFYTSFWGLRNNIHRYGLVRVLAWAPDDFKSVLVPRSVESRVRQSVHLEACSSITEIAGTGWSRAPDAYERELRWPDLVVEDAGTVQARQAAVGLDISEARRDSLPWAPLWSVPPDPELLREALGVSYVATLQEFLKLDHKLKIEVPQWREKALSEKRLPTGRTPEQKRWRKLLSDRRAIYSRFLETAKVVQEQRNLEQRWRNQSLQGGGTIAPNELQQLEEEASGLKQGLNNLTQPFATIWPKVVDDYRAYDAHPQALAWNQREFEPLLVQPQEFAPARGLSLIDVKPLPRFRQLLPSEPQCHLFDYVTARLCHPTRNSDLYTALTELLQAGVDDFIETCPILKDPVQGGWYDLTELRVRSLPVKLFIDIALAYEKWPFRPKARELLLEMGNTSFFAGPMIPGKER